jgi:DNA repair protein RadA/Sms
LSGQEKKIFFCKECGNEYPKWQGKCDYCNSWNSIVERPGEPAGKGKNVSSIFAIEKSSEILPISEITVPEEKRHILGVNELDNVFGGGIMPGSLNLIGGEPGIGKSTLLLQILNRLPGKRLYISGEESPHQIRNRADRLKINHRNIHLLCENELEKIHPAVESFRPDFLVIDSIQSVYASSISSSAGSVTQIKECGSYFLSLAKRLNITVFLIGHVTKEGGIAGPRVLEHMVDTVLFFENSANSEIRGLRSIKNRYGSANEIGLLRMTEQGLSEYKSGELLLQRKEALPGSAVTAIVEGNRSFAVEIQSLVAPSHFGYPQRTVIGFEQKKLSVLLAACEKFINHSLGNMDVYLKLIGGLRSRDPGLDLAVIASVYSSIFEVKQPGESAFIGEIGLNGEIRPVSFMEVRLKELSRVGVKRVIGPFSKKKIQGNTALTKVRHLTELPEIWNI